jgi:hypothetical protein
MEHLLPHYADIESVHQTGARPESSHSFRLNFSNVNGSLRPLAVINHFSNLAIYSDPIYFYTGNTYTD